MQTKLFVETQQTTLVPNSVNTITLSNDEERKANFHNIHWSGTIIGDHADPDNFARGHIVLFCIDQLGVATPTTMNVAILEQRQGQIILAQPFLVFSGATYNGVADTFKWQIPLGKISRTCPKDGRIEAKIYLDTSAVKDVQVQQLLSSNITQA